MTVGELEATSGVVRATIGGIATGKHPNTTLDVILRLRHALGLESIEAVLDELPSS